MDLKVLCFFGVCTIFLTSEYILCHIHCLYVYPHKSFDLVSHVFTFLLGEAIAVGYHISAEVYDLILITLLPFVIPLLHLQTWSLKTGTWQWPCNFRKVMSVR